MLLWAATSSAGGGHELRLPAWLANGAVLQRGKALPLRGWARPGDEVSVRLGRAHATATAAADGRWVATLAPQKAAGPLTLTVAAKDATGSRPAQTIELHDVWLGDVWLVSGQSNIDVNLERVYPQYADEIDRDSTSRVRLFQVANTVALDSIRPDVSTTAGWQTLTKAHAWHFSAIGYFLGKHKAAQTGVAQGIVQASWGGTPIEAWLPMDSVAAIRPDVAATTRYLADPELMRLTAAANTRAATLWDMLLDSSDPGLAANWADNTFSDTSWPEANQYALPVGGRAYNGSYWARQHITIDAAHARQAARLLVGTLVDADYTYVNGHLVGHTGYQYPPRRYTIPQGVLREGDNVIAVRFVCHGQQPAFIREKPYRLDFADGTRQALSHTWRVAQGAPMPQQHTLPTANQNSAAALWHAMLAPLAPMAMAGVVWYQGESNTGNAELYERELKALMAAWRQRLGQPTLPFAIVQLAGYMAPQPQPQESGWPRLRESQRRAAMATPWAAVVPAHDLGEANDIHPLRKKEVAARAAMVLDYLAGGNPHHPAAKTKATPAAPFPAPVDARQKGAAITVTFDQSLAEGKAMGFEVMGDDNLYHNAQATAHGRQVTIDAQGRRVRYAWKNNPVEATLCARTSGMPAVPFEADVTPGQ